MQECILIRAAIMLHIFQPEVTCIQHMVTKVVLGNKSDSHSVCNQSHTRLSILLYHSTSTLPCLEHSETHLLSDTLTHLHTMPNRCSHCTFCCCCYCCFLFWKTSQTKYQPVCLTHFVFVSENQSNKVPASLSDSVTDS